VSERGGREAEEEGGYRTKNKNLTRQCGEKIFPCSNQRKYYCNQKNIPAKLIVPLTIFYGSPQFFHGFASIFHGVHEFFHVFSSVFHPVHRFFHGCASIFRGLP